MYKLKLIKALSCRIGEVKATKKNPFCMVEDKEVANNAVMSGYFVIDGVIEDDVDSYSSDGFSKMTIAELERYAIENEIDVSECKLKSDYIAAISQSMEL